MAHQNKVLRSINAPDGGLCVDVFRRPDGSFGFEEYRRDSEDPRGWFPVGFHGDAAFPREQDALATATERVPWLKDVLDSQ